MIETNEETSNYPPSMVLILSKSIDMVCEQMLPCQNWRDALPTTLLQNTGLDYELGNVSESFPETLSYSNYLQNTESEPSLLSMYKYAFETSTTDLSLVTTPLAVLVLVVLVLMLRSIKAILLPYFSSIGRRAGRHTHGIEWERQNEERILKFGEYVFRLLFHFAVSVFGILYFYNKPWWKKHGTVYLFQDFPHHEVQVGMTWYYLVQCAYNLEALLSLAELSLTMKLQNPFDKSGKLSKNPIVMGWSKTVRGDFREMAIHHVVTNLLVIGSSYFRFTRIGSMVFLVHDISDVPVDVSKLANFLKWKKCTIAGFCTMVLFWLVFRLGILPFCIYKSILQESWMVNENVDPIYHHVYKPFFVSLVGLIILLHVLWFGMFLKMGWLLVRKGERHDLSEHKSGESQVAVSPTRNNKSSSSNGHSQANGHSSGQSQNGHAVTTNGHAGTNGTSKKLS